MARRSNRVANRRGRGNRGGGEDNNENQANIDPAILAAVNQAVANAVAQVVPQAVAHALHTNQSGNPGVTEPPTNAPLNVANNQSGAPTYVLLERFQKQKPEPFRGAPTPIDAENWIAHLEKIFEVLECTENQKVRLATYKLEGDAQRWWKALKTAEGDGYLDALTWRDFLEVFYQQYFPIADREAYRREYINIRQKHGESITNYMERFIRVAGIAGSIAGTAEEQAEKFKWGLHFESRRHLINTRFAKVSEAANAAKNLEMERIDFFSYRPESSRKRARDDQHGQDSGRQGRFPPNQHHGYVDHG